MKDDKTYKNLCYHTHNFYCDGKNNIEEMIQGAINQQIKHIGISSHAPLKIFNPWSILEVNLEKYSQEINILKQKYSHGIYVFKSLEIDYIPGYTFSFDYFRNKIKPDFIIGSVHLVKNIDTEKLWFIDGDKTECQKNLKLIFGSNIQHAITSYYSQVREMILTQKPDILAHLDKAIMNTPDFKQVEASSWYKEEIEKTLALIKEQGVILEINTRGLYKKKWHTTFPSSDVLKVAYRMKIPITISSDAHNTDEIVGEYETAKEIALNAGYTHTSIFEENIWKQIELN